VPIQDRELEHSPLSGLFTREGITVEVQIYRFAGTSDAWGFGGCRPGGWLDRLDRELLY